LQPSAELLQPVDTNLQPSAALLRPVHINLQPSGGDIGAFSLLSKCLLPALILSFIL
jgi:hypothetical protein